LFCGNIGEGSQVLSPMTVVRGHRVKIGKRVLINSGFRVSQNWTFRNPKSRFRVGPFVVDKKHQRFDSGPSAFLKIKFAETETKL
jgi:hypothetical protein